MLAAGALRAILPAQLRTGEARWVLPLVLVVQLATLIVGPAVIRLVAAITIGQAKFTNDANVLLPAAWGYVPPLGRRLPRTRSLSITHRLTLSGSGISPHQRQPHSAGSPSS